MPIKHGPGRVPGRVIVDDTCDFPGCRKVCAWGSGFCNDHHELDEGSEIEENETEENEDD